MFGVTGVLLTIHPPEINSLSFIVPLTRSQSHFVLLASLRPFHLPGIFSFSSMTCLTRSGWYWVMLAFFWAFHPPGIASWFYMDTALSSIQQADFSPLPSFINGSQAGDSSFIPFTWTWTESLTLPFPAMSSRYFVFSFQAFITTGSFSCWWWFPMISVSPYGLVIFEDKGHIC